MEGRRLRQARVGLALIEQPVDHGGRGIDDGGAGTAVDVDDEGRLIVRDETGDTRVFTGEVSVKGIYGAV